MYICVTVLYIYSTVLYIYIYMIKSHSTVEKGNIYAQMIGHLHGGATTRTKICITPLHRNMAP